MADTLLIKWQKANPPGKLGGTTLLIKVDGQTVVGNGDNPDPFTPEKIEEAREKVMQILRETVIANPPPDPAAIVIV
jgi:hypothetical protein